MNYSEYKKQGNVTTTKNFRVEDVTHKPDRVSGQTPVVMLRGFEPVSHEAIVKNIDKYINEKNVIATDTVIMPILATKHAAGCDFAFTGNEPVTLKKGEKITFFTNLKAYMQEGEVLVLTVRSSSGMNKNLELADTVSFIDMDSYDNEENEGNIRVCIKNTGDEPVTINPGDRLVQGVFLNFLPFDNITTDVTRKGVIGSTGR
jgi:dUTP pyrophosphatase